jgi:hypothetical protein
MKQNPQASFIIKPKYEAYQALVRETVCKRAKFLQIFLKKWVFRHNPLKKALLIALEDP